MKHAPFDVKWWKQLALCLIGGLAVGLSFTWNADSADITELKGSAQGSFLIVGMMVAVQFAKPAIVRVVDRTKDYLPITAKACNRLLRLDGRYCPTCGQEIPGNAPIHEVQA